MLKFASSRNDNVNSAGAMAGAIEDAVGQLGSDPCDLIVFHTTVGHDFDGLLAEAKRRCPSAQVVGCSSTGVVGKDGVSEKARALAVMAVSGMGEFAVAYADAVRGANSFEVAARVAGELKAKNANITMLNLLASGIDIAGDQAIAGIESVFGKDVPIFGGTSSDNMRARTSYQFVDEQVLERGLLLIGFADPTLTMIPVAHHGSIPIGKPFEVTRSEGNRVDELNGEPAWPLLMAKLDLDVNIDIADTFAHLALGQELPGGLTDEYDNSHFIHTIFKVDDERRSIYAPAACPVGTKLWLMQRDEDLIFKGTDRMTEKLKERLAGRTPVAVFHTDCAARGRFMFNEILKDEIVKRLQYPICQGQDVPWLGSYGFGEFTPVAGENRFHTQTSSIYALVRE